MNTDQTKRTHEEMMAHMADFDSQEAIIMASERHLPLFNRMVGDNPDGVTTIGFTPIHDDSREPEGQPEPTNYDIDEPMEVEPQKPWTNKFAPTWKEFYEDVHGNRFLDAFDYPAREQAEQLLECGGSVETVAFPFPDLSLHEHCAKAMHTENCAFCRVNFPDIYGQRQEYVCLCGSKVALDLEQCRPFVDVYECVSCQRIASASCPFLRREHLEYCVLILEHALDMVMSEQVEK